MSYHWFLLLQKHLTSGTELILMGLKIAPNEEHVQCDHRFASQPLANEPLHSSKRFDTSLQKARGTASLYGPWAALHFLASLASFGGRPENVAQMSNVFVIIKICYVHNQWYDISCANLYININVNGIPYKLTTSYYIYSFFKFLWNGLMMAVMAQTKSHWYNKYLVVLDWVHI